MSTITFDKFDVGLDLRKGSSVSDANRMRVLKNAYVTTGKVIRKRPGTVLEQEFTGGEKGTLGLVGAGGKLHTFIEGVAVGHLNALFNMNRLAHPVAPSGISFIDDGDLFSGFLYVSALYDDGSRYHHYIDIDGDIPYSSRPWNQGEYCSGVANDTFGLRWKCIASTLSIPLVSCTIVGNLSITTSVVHGMAPGDNVLLKEITDGTFTKSPITALDVGSPCTVHVTGHGYVNGDTVRISGVTDGVYNIEINADHVISAVAADTFDIVTLNCAVPGTTGFTGDDDINGEWPVLTTPTNTTFTIAAKASVTLGTGKMQRFSDAGEPVWTSVVGDQVVDGGLQTLFEAESTFIEDPDCPHSTSFTKAATKIWAIDGDDVRASAVANPRVWDATLVNLPGVILPVSTHARGSSETTAVAQYDGRLSVFFVDSVQFWDVDPNPALDAYYKSVDGVGTRFSKTPKEFSGDILFLASSGIRSITTLQFGNENLAEADVGSAIDRVIQPLISSLTFAESEFYLATGQYWCSLGVDISKPVYALTYSRTQKISAWAEYTFPYQLDDITTTDGQLYLRSGEKVYRVCSQGGCDDDGFPFDMVVEMPYLDFKKPGSTKYISSMDIVLTGSCDVQFRFDPNNPDLITDKIRLTGDTRQFQSIPVEITTASIAPVFTDTSDADVEIEAITFHYEELGPV